MEVSEAETGERKQPDLKRTRQKDRRGEGESGLNTWHLVRVNTTEIKKTTEGGFLFIFSPSQFGLLIWS